MPNNGNVSYNLPVNGSYTISQGYHGGNGKITQSLTTKGAATYTPGVVNQTIAANQYLTGVQTIKGDANLLASNIVTGVTIFNVTGNRKYANEYPHVDLFNGNVNFSWSEGTVDIGVHDAGNWILFEIGFSRGQGKGWGAVYLPMGSGVTAYGFIYSTSNNLFSVGIQRNTDGHCYFKYLLASGGGQNNVGIYVRKIIYTNSDINGW